MGYHRDKLLSYYEGNSKVSKSDYKKKIILVTIENIRFFSGEKIGT